MTALTRFAALSLEEYQASTALELARRVADGSLSPVQLAECALDLAAAAEPAINAYAALLPERARREAAVREAQARAGLVRGPLHGVPVAVKDNFYYEGEPTGKGSLTSSDEPASASSPMVARLVDGGAIVIGKTTTPEFGWKGTSSSPRTGVTRNPWDPSKNPGGSSAGSGVLWMATRNGAAALGHETGQLSAGRKADVILVDTRNVMFTPLAPGNAEQLYSHLVFAANGSAVDTTIVDGRVLMRGRKLLTLDETEILRQANEAFQRVLARI